MVLIPGLFRVYSLAVKTDITLVHMIYFIAPRFRIFTGRHNVIVHINVLSLMRNFQTSNTIDYNHSKRANLILFSSKESEN